MSEYYLLDTSSFETFIASRGKIQKQYSDIQIRYKSIVSELLEHWEGRGADAFSEDSKIVMSNLVGIKDILSTMCDTLNDCYEIFCECDNALGIKNRNTIKK